MRLSRPSAAVLVSLSSLALLWASLAAAQSALVISEPGRAASENAADEVVGILEARGFDVELRVVPVGGDPGDLFGQACIFDIRPDSPLSVATRAGLFSHVQQGGGLLLIGENTSFDARNQSLSSLVNELGGGPALVSNVPVGGLIPVDIIEPVNPAHFLSQACTPVTEVDYDGVGNGQLIELGSGTWLTGSALSAGAGIWDSGALLNAPSGVVVVALDVNFISTIAGSGTLDVHVADPLLPTQNRAFVDSVATYLCGASCCPPAPPAGPGAPNSAQAPAAPRSALSPCSASSSLSSQASVTLGARARDAAGERPARLRR